MTIADGLYSSFQTNRSQNYDVEAHNYVNDPVRHLGDEQRHNSFSLRRDSISLSNVLSTLLRKPDKNSLRRGVGSREDLGSSGSSLVGTGTGKKSERSKSFNIKCDSKTSPYFEIELMEDKRRRKSLDGYNRRLSISEYAKMFPELLSESSESISSETPKKLMKTNSFNANSGLSYSEMGALGESGYRSRKKVQRSVSSVSELIAPLIPKSDDIVSTRPEGGYEDISERQRSHSSWLDEAMPSIFSERLSSPLSKKSPLNSSTSTLSSSFSTLSPPPSSSLKIDSTPPNTSPGLSRTQELEDYAKQYENLYSKRILSNRSARVNNNLYASENGAMDSKNPSYSSMSLPRKLPPVKTLVSAFNDQINQQRLKQESRRLKLREEETGRRTVPNVYGTLPKKTKSSASFFNDENASIHFSTLRKYPKKNSSKRDSNYVILERDETPGNDNSVEGVLNGKITSNSSTYSMGPDLLRESGGTQEEKPTARSDGNGLSLCDMNASELESWRRRQEVERYRILNLGEDLSPPKLPPKKPHLRNKGTFLLETDFDEVPIIPVTTTTTTSTTVSSSSFKKPPAPSPPSSPTTATSSADWDPRSTSTPENDPRAYHRDSFMAHRREFADPEACVQKAEVSHETKEKFKNRKWKENFNRDEQALLDVKQPHIKQDHLYSDSEKNPPSELELSNLSLYSDWEKKGSHPTSSKSMRFTSDALQGIRAARTEGASSSNNQRKLSSPPPPVAPKPYNRSLSERIPKDHNSVPLSSSSFNVSGSNVVSNNPGAPVLSLSSSQIHSSKSTPSLNSNESQIVLGRKFSHQQQISENKKSHHHSEVTHPSSFEKWKRSMDSLDTTPGNSHGVRSSRSNLHHQPPPPSEIRTTKSGTLAPSSNPSHLMLDSLPDKSLSHHRATTLDHAQHQISPPKHFHSNSDSGLSSLGGRTSTMSPVSTISSVSSGSSVSSRASLRSASIVSSSTLPGDGVNLIEEEVDDERVDEELPVSSHSSPPSRHIFHSKKKKATHFQEEADCEKMFQYLARACESFPSSEKQKMSIDSLQTLFFTSPNQRTLLDYVEGTLDIEFDDPFHSLDESKRIKQDEHSLEKNSKDIKSSSGPCLTYNGFKSINGSSSDSFFPLNSKNDVEQIKADLLQKVDQKLRVLRSAQLTLKENINDNEELGKRIAERVKKLVSPCEYDKFDLHIQEMDKISNLLLGLSGRLARVENNLLALSIDGNRGDEIYRIRSEEGKLLLTKKDKLVDQLIEAKKLKQNIDRRSNLVAKILSKNLSNKSYSDYILFIKNKTRLLLDSREVYDKIKLGEEQMYALKTSSTS